MKLQRVVLLLLAMLGLVMAAPNSRAQGAPRGSLPTPDTPPVVSSPNLIIPDVTPNYIRPTERQKVRAFEFHAFGPYAFVYALSAGGLDQAFSRPHPRVRVNTALTPSGSALPADFGIQLATVTAHYGLAEIVREDVSYYPCGCKGVLPRFTHALVSTIVARRGSDGHTAFSFSGLSSPYVGTMNALAWYPCRFGIKDGFRMGNYNLASQAIRNLTLEFLYGGPNALLGRNHVSRFSGTIRQPGTNP